MPAFESLDYYNPALVLLAGMATFVGSLGVGSGMLRGLRLRLPAPWAQVAAVLLGTASLSLLVQIVAMAGFASEAALIALWLGFLAAGAVDRLRLRRAGAAERSVPRPRVDLAILVLLSSALAANLLLALAPSTKIDEIHYQILPPARILLDGALHFYLQPWPASILPQMGYPIAAAPLHALGLVDAANVWSWCIAALLAWFVARVVFHSTRSGHAAAIAAAGVAIGLYPSVYHTTGGPHALGDLALASATLALALRKDLVGSSTHEARLALVSTCCMIAGFTKVSLLPVAVTILVAEIVLTLRAGPSNWLRPLVAAVLPWAVFYLPLCLWTLWHSGSPFGAIASGVLAPSVFDAAVHEEMTRARTTNQLGLGFWLRDYVVHYPAIFPVATIGALLSPVGPRLRRISLALLVGAQLSIIAILLPHQARFVSGLHHALLAMGLIQIWPYVEHRLSRTLRLVAVACLLAPWLGVQIYRAWFLVPPALGIGDTGEYYRSYIALYDDFRELDRILPQDAVLFARGRLPSVYFPRPFYMHHLDLPSNRPAFALLAASRLDLDAPDCGYLRLAHGCRLGEPVYVNEKAHYAVYRRPGSPPAYERIEVREILDAGGARPGS